MDEIDLPASLTLLIGRHIFDGASPERVAQMHEISVEVVNKAWFKCRELLSQHFANTEDREYELLNDNALQARLHHTLQLLLEWRERELHAERFAKAEMPVEDPNSEQDVERDTTLDIGSD